MPARRGPLVEIATRAAAVTALLLAGFAACRTPPARPPAATLSAVPLEPLAGGAPMPLLEVGAGRPMVVDLYATWCQACRAQIAGLEALAATHGARLVVVGVDVGEELDVARQFAAREGISYLTFGDPEFQFADSMGVSQLPALLVVAPDGTIVHRSAHLDDATLAAVEALVTAR